MKSKIFSSATGIVIWIISALLPLFTAPLLTAPVFTVLMVCLLAELDVATSIGLAIARTGCPWARTEADKANTIHFIAFLPIGFPSIH